MKPGNILIAANGKHVYLTDFGVAKRLAAPGLTRTGFFVGTVDYCSPEQIEGKAIDARSDIYALGGVLFHCLTGRPPYEKDSDVAVITAHLLEPPPVISSVRANLPPALDAVIGKAMAKRPDDRYQTAEEMVTAADTALALAATEAAETVEAPAGVETVAAVPETAATPGAAPPTEAAPAMQEEPTVADTAARRLPVSRKLLLVVGIVVLAAVAAVVALLATRGGSSKSTTPPRPPAGSIVPTTARPWLASASGSLYATNPNGAIAQLDPATLRQIDAIADPAHPRAMVASGNRIVSANDQTVTAYRTPSFTPVGAAAFGARPILAAGAASAPIAIARTTGPDGRPHLHRPRDRERSDEDARALRGHGRLRPRAASASHPAGASSSPTGTAARSSC